MKEHLCSVEKALIAYEGECNWCGQKELAQPEQEPDRGVYWKCVRCGYAHIEDECPHCGFHTRAEFNFPPQRTWVGLTGGEVLDVLVSVDKETVRLPSMLGIFARAIEAKLKELNT